MDKVLAISQCQWQTEQILHQIPPLLDSKFSLDKIAFLYLMSVPTEGSLCHRIENQRLPARQHADRGLKASCSIGREV
jgi:hypothetical protein